MLSFQQGRSQGREGFSSSSVISLGSYPTFTTSLAVTVATAEAPRRYFYVQPTFLLQDEWLLSTLVMSFFR